MRKPEKMFIYNLFPPLAGKFTGWGPHLERAAEMGFNWIFVNTIQQPGMSGSLYSIKDYFGINGKFVDPSDEHSPEEQVRAVVRKAEGLGLKLMADLVINHCAVDSPLLKEHPEWFEWKKNGEVVHPSADENGRTVVWGDLARFAHRKTKDKEGLYRFCKSVVEYLVGLGFHGFRCDAAYQLPGSLWKRLIRETREKHNGVRFFAETLGCTADQTRKTAATGFDYIFNSSRWWDFKSAWLIEQYNLTRGIAASIGFPESHDTVRLARELDGNVEAIKQRYLFSALFSAGVMVLMGFEFGFRRKPHVVETTPADWEETGIDLREYIRDVNRLKESYTVFQEESVTDFLHDGNPAVLLMWKCSCEAMDEALVILNKDVHGKQHFEVESLQKYMQSKAPLTDVSVEHRLDYIPSPFSYDLRPGQGIVLVTRREEPAREEEEGE
jgi:starch synthase (maltosyl-transferring)